MDKQQIGFIEELEKEYNMTIAELKGYVDEAIRLKILQINIGESSDKELYAKIDYSGD